METESSRSTNNFTPILKELYPGGSSQEGFLAEGQMLNAVIERDNKALALLGYTAKEVAKLLEPVINISGRDLVKYVAPNEKEYAITVLEYRGWQDCPWRDAHIPQNSSRDIYIEGNVGTIRIPGMLPHLIVAHNFFEGGSYRLSPEGIVELFGVEKNPGSIEETKRLEPHLPKFTCRPRGNRTRIRCV
jgi:hypothetical protein